MFGVAKQTAWRL